VGDIQETDRTQDWTTFLKLYYKKQMGEISREYPHKRSLIINYRDVEKWGKTGIALADELIENPGKVIEDIRDAIKTNALIRTGDNKEIKDLNIRFSGVAKKRLLRDLRYDDVNTLVAIEGAIVTRATEVRPRITEAVFRCPAGHFTHKIQGSHSRFVEPNGCMTDGCQFKKLDLIPARSRFTNQQKLKIQENSEGLAPGAQPQVMDVIVLDDACDDLYPGDRATINAIVRATQRIVKGEKSTVFDLFLELSSIEASQRDFEEIAITEDAETKIKEIAKSGDALELIASSIAPSIYGYTDIKRGIALQMFGGVESVNTDGTINRPDIHILILGDPGTAKSKLIKYASRQSPRGVYASAVTSSGVGLSGMATRDDDGRWMIEAGALPLADKGVAAIDEIDKADPETIDSLLNIAEEGEVRIIKAGQNRLLKARCSLICAGNPKYERFDPFADISEQITIPPAFLSRIDLFYLMIDNPEPKSDEEKSRHVVKTRYIAECRAAGKLDRVSEEDLKLTEIPISGALLKQYIAYAKRNIIPIMNVQVREYLTKHYLKIRGKPTENAPSPATMRQQEALIRLAEASARIRLSGEVTLKDAEYAISIYDACMESVCKDPKTGKIDLGRIGQGVSQEKKNMIGALREVIKNEPKLSKELLLAKMAERSFKDEHTIMSAVDTAKRCGDIMEPRHEHYTWEGK